MTQIHESIKPTVISVDMLKSYQSYCWRRVVDIEVAGWKSGKAEQRRLTVALKLRKMSPSAAI